MRKLRTLVATIGICSAPSLALATPSSATSHGEGVVVSHVTVTAAKFSGNSAVSMTIENISNGPISLLSVTSPDTQSSMIDYDTNMCQGNHAMMMLANIFISSGHTQKLGYKYQGAMLRHMKMKTVSGESIPVVITWTNFKSAHTVTIHAKVVDPPRHLDFGMSSMEM